MLDDQGDPPRLLRMLFQPALEELQARHPDIEIQLDYRPIPYLNLYSRFLATMSNQTPVGIMTVDRISLGEFVEKGFLSDLIDYAKKWGRQKDWYTANWDGGIYNDKIYGIWTVADVRGIWYWKDLLNEAHVHPNLLKTWDGYIASAKKLNDALKDKGIQGMHLVGASHSPDMSFYPYLWMLGGEVLEWKSGHSTKSSYWFPAYNGTEGVRALEFIKEQVNVGIKPQKNHYGGKEFFDRKFAVVLEALQNHVHDNYNISTPEKRQDFEKKVGFLPVFPIPNEGYPTTTLIGGWLLSVPSTSKDKDLAWELITIMLEPKIIAPMHEKYGLLPTQIPIGEGPYSANLGKAIPYYDKLVSMLKIGRYGPNIPEQPQIAEHIRQVLNDLFYNNTNEPKQALANAAAKSAKALGW